MAFLKIIVDIATCFCTLFVVKKICEFLFYRYLSGIDNFVMASDDRFTLIVMLIAGVGLYILGLKVLRSSSITKIFNLLGFAVCIVAFIMMKWKRGDTGEHPLTTYLPGVIGFMVMEFILMAR